METALFIILLESMAIISLVALVVFTRQKFFSRDKTDQEMRDKNSYAQGGMHVSAFFFMVFILVFFYVYQFRGLIYEEALDITLAVVVLAGVRSTLFIVATLQIAFFRFKEHNRAESKRKAKAADQKERVLTEKQKQRLEIREKKQQDKKDAAELKLKKKEELRELKIKQRNELLKAQGKPIPAIKEKTPRVKKEKTPKEKTPKGEKRKFFGKKKTEDNIEVVVPELEETNDNKNTGPVKHYIYMHPCLYVIPDDIYKKYEDKIASLKSKKINLPKKDIEELRQLNFAHGYFANPYAYQLTIMNTEGKKPFQSKEFNKMPNDAKEAYVADIKTKVGPTEVIAALKTLPENYQYNEKLVDLFLGEGDPTIINIPTEE